MLFRRSCASRGYFTARTVSPPKYSWSRSLQFTFSYNLHYHFIVIYACPIICISIKSFTVSLPVAFIPYY